MAVDAEVVSLTVVLPAFPELLDEFDAGVLVAVPGLETYKISPG